jgi:hypothetical protein
VGSILSLTSLRKPQVLSVVGVGLALVLTACSAETNNATNVSWNSATYNATLHWSPGDGPGHLWFEHSIDGGPFTAANSADSFPKLTNSGSAPYSKNISGLPPEESIRYRICGYLDANPTGTYSCYDKAGTQGGTNYTSFTTGAQPCTRTVAAGTAWPAASNGLTAGQKLCLSAGSYDWGDFYPQSGLTISGNANTTITGEARLENPNIALRHLVIQAADDEDHSVIDMRANNDTVRNLEVNTRHIGQVMGIIVGGGDAAPSGVRIYDTKVHGPRPNAGRPCYHPQDDPPDAPLTGSQVHAIYWGNGTNGKIERDWLYDYSGYGLHIYAGNQGTAAGLAISQVISDSSDSCATSLGDIFNDLTGPVTATRTIVQGGVWACRVPGITVTYSQTSGGFEDCPASSTNNVSNTTFENPPTSYRIPGNPYYTFVPGP